MLNKIIFSPAMSNTYTRRKTKGQIQKELNEIERKKAELAEEERIEAAKWVEGSKQTTSNDLKKEKELEKRKHKILLKELYEKEMEI